MSPFFTLYPSFTGRRTISPLTSGEICACTSGCIFPVAVTTCVSVRVLTFSTLTARTGSFLLPRNTISPSTMITSPMTEKMISFFRDFFPFVAILLAP